MAINKANIPVRILHVFGKMDRGGSETMIMNIYRHIDKRIIQFDFVVHSKEKGSYEDEIKQLGGEIHRLPYYRINQHKSYLRSWENLFIKHPEYKVIHGHYFTLSPIYFKIAKKYKLICIAHIHSDVKGNLLKRIIIQQFLKSLKKISDYFFACSKSSAIWIFGKNILSDRRFHIINNAIDINQFIFNLDTRNKIKKELNLSNSFVIGHVGRFEPVKNHMFILQIFKKIQKEKEDSKLLLIGDGKLKDKVVKKAINLGVFDDVIFAGIRSDVSELLQAMDVFILPSKYEGIPLSLIEAQASGLRCIVSKTINSATNITGLVRYVPLESSQINWKNSILGCVEYKRNNTRTALVSAGYDIETNSKWFGSFYQQVITKKFNPKDPC